MKTSTKLVGLVTLFAPFVLFWHGSAGAFQPMSVAQIMANARTVVGYSYWWGHGTWDPAGATYPGKCSGSCPKCSHSATGGGPQYGADCSGFVGKAWQVPDTIAMTNPNRAPYTASSYTGSGKYWKSIKRKDWAQGDALATSKHVVILDGFSNAGRGNTYECAGCSKGCIHRSTSISRYVGARRNGTTTNGVEPKGKLEAAKCEGIKGWAQDPDAAKDSIKVIVSFLGPLDYKNAIPVEATADVERTDLKDALGTSNHGFDVKIPTKLKDGKRHYVYAYAVDKAPEGKESSAKPKLLLGAPMTFTCTAECGQIVEEKGWQTLACETEGNNACGGMGIKTEDCDFCCGSTCTTDSCGDGNVCAWNGYHYCCRPQGTAGTECIADVDCGEGSGQVCAWNGEMFACMAPSCADYQ